MPSSASQRLRVELQAIGENLNSWGDTRLNEALKRLEEGIAKVLPVTIAGSNVTLTSSNYVEDEARSMVLVLGGTPGTTRKVVIPLVQKVYLVVNNTDADQTIGGATGNAATIRQGKWGWVYCDATNTQTYDPKVTDLNPPTSSFDMNGQRIVDVADPVDNQDVTTKAWVAATYASAVQEAEDWANKTSGTVDGSEYSAKEYAVGTTVAVGSAKDWATSTTTVDGGLKGARGYAADADTSADAAAASEVAAAASAVDAAASAAKLTGTSTTSNSIGTGSKSFTTQSGKFFDVGARVLITSDGAPASRSMFGTVTAYSGTSLTVSVAAIVGSGTYTDWTIRVSGERGAEGPAGAVNLTRSAKTSGYTAVLADKGTLIDCTSGTFTLALDPASNLGNGFYCYVRNSGTGTITIDPNSTETIDSASTLRVHPGDTRIVLCDGSNFFSILSGGSTRVLLSSTTVGSAVASVAFTSLPTSDFTAIEVDFAGLSGDAISNISLNVTPDGSTWRTAAGGGTLYDEGGSTLLENGALLRGIATASGLGGCVRLLNMASSSFRTNATGQATSSDTNKRYSFPAVEYSNLEAHTGLRLIPASGNIDAGTIRIYGVR